MAGIRARDVNHRLGTLRFVQSPERMANRNEHLPGRQIERIGAEYRTDGIRMGTYEVSERRACRVIRLSRATIRYRSIRPPQDALHKRIREIAQVRIRSGYKRIHVLFRRKGIHVNHKRIYRLYCEEGLQLRTKRPRQYMSAAHRREQIKATQPNQYWSMDFVADRFGDGKRFRAQTVVDIYTRECLTIYPG